MGNITNTYLDEFIVLNTTNRTITLGDLVHVSVPPKQKIDLLKVPRVTKDKINQSVHLSQAIKSGLLKIVKKNPKKTKRIEKEQIIANAGDITDVENVVETDARSKSLIVTSPTASEELPFWLTENDIDLLEIVGLTDTGTLTFALESRNVSSAYTAGTSLLNSDLIASSSSVSSTSFSVSRISEDYWIVLTSSARSGSPTKLTISIKYQDVL